MAMPLPDRDDDAPGALEAARIRHLEAEVERLRGLLRNQEAALRTACRVLQPYLGGITGR